MTKVERRIANIVAEIAVIEPESVTLEGTLDSYGIDSLDIQGLELEIEDSFRFTDDDFVLTVDDTVLTISEKVNIRL